MFIILYAVLLLSYFFVPLEKVSFSLGGFESKELSFTVFDFAKGTSNEFFSIKSMIEPIIMIIFCGLGLILSLQKWKLVNIYSFFYPVLSFYCISSLNDINIEQHIIESKYANFAIDHILNSMSHWEAVNGLIVWFFICVGLVLTSVISIILSFTKKHYRI